MTILFPDGGTTVFPWYRTYPWSREYGSGPSALTSALMALEAWSHGRIEAGEPIEKVIADIIGAPNPPAAYLLVIVDVLLSHWPASSAAAIPFLACPELLCLDRQRTGGDNIEVPGYFRAEAPSKGAGRSFQHREPEGTALAAPYPRPLARFLRTRGIQRTAQDARRSAGARRSEAWPGRPRRWIWETLHSWPFMPGTGSTRRTGGK